MVSMEGRGAFSVRENGEVYHLRPGDTDQIIDSMSHDDCRTYHIAAQNGDAARARSIFVNAAKAFYASAPAAPTAAVARPQQRSQRRIPRYYA